LPVAGLNDNFNQGLYYAQETQYDAANQSTAGLQAQITVANDNAANAVVTANAADAAADAATIAANNATTFTQTGVGATPRTIESKLRDVVSVKDFGAVGNGVADDTAAFNSAAATASTVLVPKGIYQITAPTSSACWQLEIGALITGLPNKGTAGGGVQDTSRLTGTIVSLSSGGVNTLKVGDTDPWLTGQRDTVDFLSTFMSVSRVGAIAGSFATRSSDNPTPNMQTIAVSAFGVNDNTAFPEPSWCIYTESIRYANTGPAFGAEMDFINLGNTLNLTPFSSFDPYSSAFAPTANLWLSCGGGDSGLAPGSNNISAAVVFLPNSKKFNSGIVVRNGSIETANIVVAPPLYKYTWSDSSERTVSTLDHRQHFRAVYSDITSLAPADINKKYKANGTSPTVLGEIIARESNQGFNGTADYPGAETVVTQETDFASSNARFRYTMSARNIDGGFTVVGLNWAGDARFTPTTDNNVNLGAAAYRWSTVFAGNGTINTSDGRLKQDILELSGKELLVAKEIKGLIRRFRYVDAVEKKGVAARLHVGVIAQDVINAFAAQGLDATQYGILCYDEWEDQPDTLDSEGNVIQKGRKAGNIYGIRYDELLTFVLAAI
jgi:hypothetical protein